MQLVLSINFQNVLSNGRFDVFQLDLEWFSVVFFINRASILKFRNNMSDMESWNVNLEDLT